MKALEKQLDKAGGKFITGNRMTLADFVLLSQLQDLKLLQLESGDYPRHGGPRPILGHLLQISKNYSYQLQQICIELALQLA